MSHVDFNAPRSRPHRNVLFMTPRRKQVWRTAASHASFGVVPIVTTILFLLMWSRSSVLALDFHNWFWPAGHRVLHGASLYTDPFPYTFFYPAPAALLFAPFAAIPREIADALFVALNILAAIGALRTLEVKDWRLYGAVMLWPAVIVGWQTANVTLLFGFGLALAWKYRDSPIVTGALIALMFSVKMFVWPLAVWLIATRRWKALAWTVAGTAVINLVAWAVVGFAQLSTYAHALHTFAVWGDRSGYSLVSVALHLGIGQSAASALVLLIAAAGAITMLLGVTRRGDAWTFATGVVLILAASPVVWPHYLALLIVPLALLRPRIGFVWVLPLCLFTCPAGSPSQGQRLLTLGVAALVAGRALSTSAGRPPARSSSAPVDRIVRVLRAASLREASNA